MKIVCDACSAKYSIADEKVRGKVFKIRCKKCSNIIVVRGAAEAEQPAGFDQKETHVFDYHQEGGHGPTVEGAPDDEVWYLVIDGEQAGPLSPAQVRDRFASGDVDADTYAWREGYADWERLGSIAEFRDLDAAGDEAAMGGAVPGAEEAAAAGMFGGPAVDAPEAAQSDPNDLFAAQSNVVAPAGAVAAPAAGGGSAADDLFAAAPASNGAAADAGQAPANVQSSLTGQRSENSVLFSLNNLASLAGGDEPAKAASPAAASPSPGSSSSGTEGSGLIDIRSMASVYLGDQPSSSAPKDKGDDIPVLGGGGFESASPVLLPPTQPAQSNNKLLYILLGVIGFLLVSATILILVVVTKADSSEPQLAGVTESDAGGVEAAVDDEPEAEGDDEGSEIAAAVDDEPEDVDEPVDEPEEAPPAAEKRTPSRQLTGAERRRQQRRERERSREREQRQEKESSSPPDTSSSSNQSGCDEVSCLVTPNKACCAKYRRGSSGGSGGSSGSSDKPVRLTKSDVRRGMSRVRSRVSACGDRHNISGTVQVRVKVAPNGRVRGASASGVSGSGKSCVQSAVRRARFKATQRGMTFNYPFAFR